MIRDRPSAIELHQIIYRLVLIDNLNLRLMSVGDRAFPTVGLERALDITFASDPVLTLGLVAKRFGGITQE